MKPAPLGSQDWTRGTKSSPEILPSTISCPAPSSPPSFTTGSSPTTTFHYSSGSQPDLFRKAGHKALYTNLGKELFKNTMFLFFGGSIFSFIDCLSTPLQIAEFLRTPGWRITPDISDSLSQKPTQSPSSPHEGRAEETLATVTGKKWQSNYWTRGFKLTSVGIQIYIPITSVAIPPYRHPARTSLFPVCTSK